MGEVVQTLLEHFKKARRVVVSRRSLPLKRQQLEDVHRKSLINDIAYALEIEVQRPACGDVATDGMLDRFCEFREHYSLYPNDYDASSMLAHILYDYTIQKGSYPYESAFNRMMGECHENRIQYGVLDYTQKIWLSLASNTAEGIRIFQKWCQDDEGKTILPAIRASMLTYGVERTARHFAGEFVDKYLKISKIQIERNTERTLERIQAQSSRALLEHRCEKVGLRLVKG